MDLGGLPPAETVTDRVYGRLYDSIVELRLTPGQKISEVEVAQQFDVSRQPVRDAFYRLSRLGFLTIRPQRATVVSPISPEGVMRACFMRTGIEIEVLELLGTLPETRENGLSQAEAMVELQCSALSGDDRVRFHELDDAMHRALFEAAGKGFAWDVVRESKAHMDRVRHISLELGARQPYDDHLYLLDALRRGDVGAAKERMRRHLGRVSDVMEQAMLEKPELFAPA